MSSPEFASLDDYLASLNAAKAKTISAIIALVLAEFPELESKIAWSVPTIHRYGKYVLGLAAYKHHLTFAPWSTWVMEDFKERLARFVVFKNCFQIQLDWDIDRELVLDWTRTPTCPRTPDAPRRCAA